MESPLSFPTNTWVTILAVALFVCFFTWKSRNGGKKLAKGKKLAPEATGGLPVIGHLLQLGGRKILHKRLGEMSDKFGPIFSVKIGVHSAVVVSNWELAKECFTTNDAVFSNRPRSMAVEQLGYNYANFGFGPYGAYWRQIRKITVMELLSNRRLEFLGKIRQSEVKMAMREIYDQWTKNKSETGSDKALVEMKQWFNNLTINIMVRIVTGKRLSGREEKGVSEFQAAMNAVMKFMGTFLVSDALPFLRFLDLGGHEKAMKRTFKDIDRILQKWVDEHKEKRLSGKAESEVDFIDMMISAFKGMAPPQDRSYDDDTMNKANCLGAIIGGTDTTTVTLTWTLSLLLNHRHVLKKALEELNFHVGKDRQVEDSDLKNLVYIHAIIKEALRLYPPGPLLGPRESMEDCTVDGYFIPKGTRLVVNAWKIHRDPRVYSDPNEFKPERHLEEHKHLDVRGTDFELIPFGCGRRICAGISLAMQVLHYSLATLLQGFEFATVANELVDMSEGPGLSNLKATPLDVLVTPRLSSSLY